MEAIKLTVKQIILQFKTLFGSPFQIGLLLFIPFIITSILPVFFFGVKDSYGITATLSISISVFIAYSYFVGEYRRSTLYKNLQTTKSNRWVFNTSSFISIFIIGILTYIFHFMLMFIYSNLNLIQISILTSMNDQLKISMFNIPFIWTLYWVSITILVSFSIGFGVYRFVSSPRTYYIFIITIVLLAIVFGATFNNYFQTFLSSGDCFLFNGPIVRAIFPKQMFMPSLFYPLYASSQMLNVSGVKTVIWSGTNIPQFEAVIIWKWQSATDYIGQPINDAWRWNILYFVPYIQCIAWIGTGTLVSWLKNN